MLIGAGTTADRVAAATPGERDRFADLLRVAASWSWSPGAGWASFVRARAARLLRPTVVFLAVWAVAGTALGLAGVPGTALRPLALLVVQPLWFLGVYLLVVALAPAMLRLHRRFGPAVVVWLGLAAAAADLTGRLPGLDRVTNGNFVLVWLFAHQLGFLYADGALTRWPAGSTPPWPPVASPPWVPSPAPAPGRRAWSASPASGSPT
jgi:hypothetical protein